MVKSSGPRLWVLWLLLYPSVNYLTPSVNYFTPP